MKFFFPDSQDFIDPTFDFLTERRSSERLRARDDRYAHEVFQTPPFDGLLVSKAIVDGTEGSGKSAKYSLAQRHRLLRNGVREFFRLDDYLGSRCIVTMGDCGAFSYVKEEKPPFSVESVVQFYDSCGFDFGISVDHVILGFDAELDHVFPRMRLVPKAWEQRQELTLELAAEFKRLHKEHGSQFQPVGVAQGWSPKSYASAFRELQRMGYQRIALGGMVPLKTPDIVAVLEAISKKKKPSVEIHLLGVTRTDHVETFAKFGVTSFDTTSPFLRAFKDARQNYFTQNDSFTALRIPQVQGNARVERLIRAGAVDQRQARRLEQESLSRLRQFDAGTLTVDKVLDVLVEYETLVSPDGSVHPSRRQTYARTLEARPWQSCPCEVCRAVGVDVMIFRGSERNKRRGFHNLYVLYERLHKELRRGHAKTAVASPSAGDSRTTKASMALR